MGWVNFNPTHSQVTIDTSTLKFDGYAWAENVGYIHFQNASPLYYVKEAVAPTVTTTAASSITTTAALSGGNVTSDGGTPVTARGVCWSTSANPSILDAHTTDGMGTGSFTSSITGLSPNTTYHVRAWATNHDGTAYGSDLTFITDPQAPNSDHPVGGPHRHNHGNRETEISRISVLPLPPNTAFAGTPQACQQ